MCAQSLNQGQSFPPDSLILQRPKLTAAYSGGCGPPTVGLLTPGCSTQWFHSEPLYSPLLFSLRIRDVGEPGLQGSSISQSACYQHLRLGILSYQGLLWALFLPHDSSARSSPEIADIIQGGTHRKPYPGFGLSGGTVSCTQPPMIVQPLGESMR